jgi:hypothetical protein
MRFDGRNVAELWLRGQSDIDELKQLWDGAFLGDFESTYVHKVIKNTAEPTIDRVSLTAPCMQPQLFCIGLTC